MKNSKRMLVLLVTFVIMLASFTTGIMAAIPDDTIMPLWTSIYEVELYMDFVGTTCCPGIIASKQSTATSIEGTLTVYEEIDSQWVEVDSWYGRVTRGTLALGEDFAATSGVRYKAVANITAYTGNVPESETFELIKTCP